VKESLFARLGDVRGARVLDLFAGTGALAIEALSRGAARAVLVDLSARAVGVVRRNLAALGLEQRARLIRGDAVRSVRRLAGSEHFDLVLLDPPYDSDRLEPSLRAIVESAVLAPGAVVVVETAKRHSLPPVFGLTLLEARSYGDTRLIWLAPEAPVGGSGQPDEDGPGEHE
jgi:16S rRNA (guanine966-N2)-methyltransferase